MKVWPKHPLFSSTYHHVWDKISFPMICSFYQYSHKCLIISKSGKQVRDITISLRKSIATAEAENCRCSEILNILTQPYANAHN